MGKRLAGLAVGLALAACGEVGPSSGGPGPSPSPTSQPAAGDPWRNLEPGWTELAPPPFTRARAASVWTGRELFYWGGDTFYGGEAHGEGALYDPFQDRWRSLPTSPIEGRSSPAAVWTGSEVLVWGGWANAATGNGAAYSPATDSWRELAPSPLGSRDPAASVWTGREMVVWGNTDRTAGASDGAAYDPAADRWRSIADAPLKLNLVSTVWTGTEMIVYGADLDNNNRSKTDYAQGMAYDPAADSWRLLSRIRLSPQASTAVWGGTEMIVWDYELAAGAYDPVANRWRKLPRVLLEFSECYPDSAITQGIVFARCGGDVLFDVARDKWTAIEGPGVVVAGRPVAADGVFLFAGARHEGTDNALWAFRPRERTAPHAPNKGASAEEPDCGKINVASDEYGSTLSTNRGRPGDVVTMSGTTLRGEDGRYAPSDRIEAWWNADGPIGVPLEEGPVVRLFRVNTEGCNFSAQFEVPDAPPGVYRISVVVWEEHPDEGYGWFLPHEFEVVAD